MTIRWGIIGLGEIAEQNFVPALAQANNATLLESSRHGRAVKL